MGGTHSKIDQAAEVASDTFFESVVSLKQDCRATASAFNSSSIVASGKYSQAELDALKPCLATGKSMRECTGQGKGIVLQETDLEQTSKVTLKSTCSVDQSLTSDIVNKMTTELVQKASSKNDAAGEALKALTGGSTLDMNNVAVIKNAMSTVFTTEMINEVITNATAVNSSDIRAEAGLGANVIGQGTKKKQNAYVQAFTDAVMKNKQIANYVNTQESSVQQKSSYSSSMVACIVSCIVSLVIAIVVGFIAYAYNPEKAGASAAKGAVSGAS